MGAHLLNSFCSITNDCNCVVCFLSLPFNYHQVLSVYSLCDICASFIRMKTLMDTDYKWAVYVTVSCETKRHATCKHCQRERGSEGRKGEGGSYLRERAP